MVEQMNNRDGILVSVIVATYNSDWEKTKQTLNSIIVQQDISFEIIISDDGSAQNNYEYIRKFFSECNFVRYTLIDNKENLGTVKNVLKAVNYSKGKYVKLISPGDMFVGDNLLSDWVNFLQNSGKRWSFGNVLNTPNSLGKPIELVAKTQIPFNIDGYVDGNELLARYDCVVRLNKPHGVSALLEKNLYEQYLPFLAQVIKYADDFIFVFLQLNNIMPVYFPGNVILYECGTGISSGNSSHWMDVLQSETDTIQELINKSEEYYELIEWGKDPNNLRLLQKRRRITSLTVEETELTEVGYAECVFAELEKLKQKCGGRALWIYGAGFWGKKLSHILREEGFKVRGFIDKNSKLLSVIEGLPVVGIEGVEVNNSFVIISLIDCECEVNGFLKQHNFGQDQLYYINLSKPIKSL